MAPATGCIYSEACSDCHDSDDTRPPCGGRLTPLVDRRDERSAADHGHGQWRLHGASPAPRRHLPPAQSARLGISAMPMRGFAWRAMALHGAHDVQGPALRPRRVRLQRYSTTVRPTAGLASKRWVAQKVLVVNSSKVRSNSGHQPARLAQRPEGHSQGHCAQRGTR